MALTKSVDEIIAGDKTGLLAKHASWERVPLQVVASILNGYPFESAYFNHTSGTPLIRIRDVAAGSTSTYFSESFDQSFLVRRGELLVGMDGDFNVARWRSDPALLNQRVCKISIDEQRYSAALLEYTLPGYLSAINASTSSITVKHLSSRTIGEIALPLPPRQEQVRIVEKLDELLSDLDAGVAELKTAQKKLAKYRQSLLKAAVDGTLTASWREAQRQREGEPKETGAQLLERILIERRARWEATQLAKFRKQGKQPREAWKDAYLEPATPDISALHALPLGWVWASIEQLGEVQLGRQRSPDKMKGLSPIKYIRAANITERGVDFDDVLEMDFSDSEQITFELKPGDVLLTEASGSPEHVGRPVVWPRVGGLFCFQNTVLRFSSQGIASDFAFRLFQAWQKLGIFRKLSSGVGINHLSAGKFSKLAVPLPPVDEQRAFVDAIESTFSILERQRVTIEGSLRQAAAQRQNILKAAFSGRLVPQDPNDEPASVLLERIRSERAANKVKLIAKRRRVATPSP